MPSPRSLPPSPEHSDEDAVPEQDGGAGATAPDREGTTGETDKGGADQLMPDVDKLTDEEAPRVPSGERVDYLRACLGTCAGGPFGALGTMVCCNSLRGRAGAATGCQMLAVWSCIVLLLLVALGEHTEPLRRAVWNEEGEHSVHRPAPVGGLLYSWEVAQSDCAHGGGSWVPRSALGAWCSGACPPGFAHRVLDLGRPEQRHYCVALGVVPEPQPDLGNQPCSFAPGAAVRLVNNATLLSGVILQRGEKGTVVSNFRGPTGSPLVQVRYGVHIAEFATDSVQCPLMPDWGEADEVDDDDVGSIAVPEAAGDSGNAGKMRRVLAIYASIAGALLLILVLTYWLRGRWLRQAAAQDRDSERKHCPFRRGPSLDAQGRQGEGGSQSSDSPEDPLPNAHPVEV